MSYKGAARGMREPGGAIRTVVLSGAEGGRRKGSADRSAAGGGAREFTYLGGARDWKTRGRSAQDSGVRGEDKWMKGTSRGGPEELVVIGRGSERGRLSGISG